MKKIIIGLSIIIVVVVFIGIFVSLNNPVSIIVGNLLHINTSGLEGKICELRGGMQSCISGFNGCYSYYCEFPYKDAGSECFNSAQCQGKCLLTESQLDDLEIPHYTGFNIFYYQPGRISNGASSYANRSIENPLMTIILPSEMELIGICQDYSIKSHKGAYELNIGTATLIHGSLEIP